MHCNNVGLNVPDNAPLAVYQATLVEHWLVMGLETNSSPVDARLSKMEAVATPLWPSVRMKLTLLKLGIWSPPGLPNF
jgi:hypothetical protein